MATSAGSAQIAVRARGNKNCSVHHGKQVVYYCKNCEKLVCGECAIQECQGHVFEGFSSIIPAATQKLQNFIHQIEDTEIPRTRQQLQEVDSALSKTRKGYQVKITNIRQQNEALKGELDKIAETWIKTCHGMEQKSLDGLHNHKKALQTRIDDLSSQLQDVRKTLQSGDNILMFDISNGILSEFDDLPRLPVSRTVEFNPGNIQIEKLEQLLGDLNISAQNKLRTSSLIPREYMKVMSKFTPYIKHIGKSIHVTAGDQAWLSFYNADTLKPVVKMLLTNQAGQVLQTFDMDVSVRDFCLSPQTGNMWFCSETDNTVREVNGGKSTMKFKTDILPRCICVTRDGHVIIGRKGLLVKYTQGGQEICKTSGGYPVSPYHLSECSLTANLAVVDQDLKEHGGNDKPLVFILNDHLQYLYHYTGGRQSPRKPFFPQDACYTDQGDLIITDWNNKRVVLVTATGRFLKLLFNLSTVKPVAVCVHGDVLWVSFSNGTVQVIKII